jgi:hypothetical protein
VVRAVGGGVGVPVAEERVGLRVELDRAGQPAVVVKDAADERQALDEFRA